MEIKNGMDYSKLIYIDNDEIIYMTMDFETKKMVVRVREIPNIGNGEKK